MNRKPILILLVDDSPPLLKSLKRILYDPQFNQEIQCVDNGKEAFELCKETPFHIVVTDLNMPDMNGAELIHKLSEIRPATRCVVMCGDSTSPEAEELARMGYLIINKPCSRNCFQDAIANEIKKIPEHDDSNE